MQLETAGLYRRPHLSGADMIGLVALYTLSRDFSAIQRHKQAQRAKSLVAVNCSIADGTLRWIDSSLICSLKRIVWTTAAQLRVQQPDYVLWAIVQHFRIGRFPGVPGHD